MYWRSQSINDVKIVFQTFGYGDLNLLERLSSASNQIVHIQYSIIVFCVAHLFAYRTFLTSTTEFWVSLSIIQLTESKKPNNTLYQQLYNAEASDSLSWIISTKTTFLNCYGHFITLSLVISSPYAEVQLKRSFFRWYTRIYFASKVFDWIIE